MIEASGIPVEIFSGGHTAVYDITAEFPEITDIQAGTYVFMDWPYRQLEGLDKFREALTVLTTIISIPRHQGDMAYTDCGTKNIATEHTSDYSRIVLPKVKGETGELLHVVNLSEEHGHLKGDVSRPKVGDKLEFIPFHACTTPVRCDIAYVVSDEHVIGRWSIPAQGMARLDNKLHQCNLRDMVSHIAKQSVV